ncbi:hypothetical protein SAMN05421847_1728 [Halpernia humi]|uniref:N-acetyltransferase domain-containing protein n=1 Tax=Halpernia humi TaxID=493375 RepID=A0A1H5Y970_9FLAO|nr:GNAT family N-acetyltransferase [Halpernia humi]SEG20518.1 hypothetical protein SAMN05421847_1728 [Halpernia humi]
MIKLISTEETHPLRKSVLGENIPNYQYIYKGDDDEKTLHFGWFENETLGGILTAMKTEEKIWQFRGMAVSQSHQAKNIGSQLLQFASNYLKNEAEVIWLNAREKVVNFYLKNGFTAASDFFDIKPIGLHLKMSKLNKENIDFNHKLH